MRTFAAVSLFAAALGAALPQARANSASERLASLKAAEEAVAAVRLAIANPALDAPGRAALRRACRARGVSVSVSSAIENESLFE